MKKLSLDQLKEKVTVVSEHEATQSISGGESIFYWFEFAAEAAYDSLEWALGDLFED